MPIHTSEKSIMNNIEGNILNLPTEKLISSDIQKKINWFAFFLAFPFLSIAGNSITFFIFIAIVIKVGAFWKKNYQGKFLLFGFLFIGLLATIATPFIEQHENLGSILIYIQFCYWIFMASFFVVYYKQIDFIQVSKWIFYGVIGYSIAFYLTPFEFKSAFLSLEFKPGRNSFVFNMLACIPLTFAYIQHTQKGVKVYLFMLLFLLIVFLTNGRSGSIIIVIQLLFILIILKPNFQRVAKVFIVLFGLLFVILQSSGVEAYIDSTANSIESINPRLASLLRSEGEGDLTQDKSWLIRKLMIEKGGEIVNEYPFLGVGPNNFKLYKAELSSFKKYNRLHGIGKHHFEAGTSAHNTYLQVITEFGILGAICYLLLLIRPLYYLLRLFIRSKLTLESAILVSLFGISIHFYTIANLTGALPWFIIGLSWALIHVNKSRTGKQWN